MGDIEPKLKKVRLIQWALIAVVPIFAFVAEIGHSRGSNDWTWRHWLVAGLALWSVSGGFHLRRLGHRSEQALGKGAPNPKAVRQWEAGQIIGLAMAEGVAMVGLVVRMVLGGALWQASLFYAAGLFLLLLWTPRMPIRSALM
jgi:F0F1-type ATP synthase membrane subunit c/vacuolar-type H+-ATPase subunit K